MNKLVSIVVPVYNTDKYIEECIKSICNQTYTNLQIIIVDDGSTDLSMQICVKLQKMDERITIIKNSHMGAVYARKCGVKNANGDFVTFIDSDDYIDEKLIETLLNKMDEHTDMVSSNIYLYSLKNKFTIGSSLPQGLYENEQLYDIFDKLIYNEETGAVGLFQSLSGKLFVRNKLWGIIKDEKNTLGLGDDAAVVYPYVLESNKVILINDCLYYYRVNENSMTHTLDVNAFKQIYDFMIYMYTSFQKYPEEWNLNAQLHKYILHLLQASILSVYGIKAEPIYYINRKFKRNDRIALYGIGRVGKSLLNILYNDVDKIILYDENKVGQTYKNKIIMSPDDINENDFDYIIIAIKNEKLASEIAKILLKRGVSENKIYWEEPKINKNIYTIE